MKPVLLIFLLTLMSITVTFGQVKIGDNPQNIDPSSVLELESTSRVLVITRVSTLEMEAIIPQRGGVVYNTDTECMHYYNGTSWINLCDATSFSLTNEPIENITSTISIVDNGTTINLEVAPNSIRSENIVDGGINGDDIQDNSIGESKLGADSVGADELRDNTVGASEIIDGSITPIDMANTIPNQVLTTDSNGTVNWEDTSNLRGAVADEVSITGSGTAADPLTLTDAITANILSNTTAITAHVSADNDTDNQNEVLTSAALEGNELVLTESGVERRVDLGPLNNTGTDNQTLNLNVNSLEITNGNTVNLAKYLDNTDEQQLTLSGNRISLTDGGFVDLPPGTIDTDEQQLTIAGNRISLTDGGFVDLPAGTVDTDNQAITGGAVVGNELRIDIEDGISGTIDISSLTATGTDSQNLTGATLSPTNILQIDIQNGNSTSVDLSALAGGGAGSTEEADGATILGLGTPTDQFRVGSIGSSELTNGSVLLEDLNPNGANNGQIIKWDETANAGVGGWIVADDRTDGTGVPALTDGTILLGDGTDTPQERVVSGDATLDNTGVLTISEDAITLPKLAPGTVAGQLLQWNGTDWVYITEADINPTIVSTDVDNSLTLSAVDGGAFYDDSTKEDAANKSIDGTLTDNSDVDFPTEQAVKTYVDTQIAAISAQTIVSADADNSITTSAVDGGAFYDDSTLSIATTANSAAILVNTTDITDKEDAANKSIDGTLAGNSDVDFPSEQAVKTYVDTQISSLTIGNNLSNSDLTLDAERTHDLAGFNLILEGTGNVGIGNLPGAPQDKLDVDGQIRARNGFAASNGTEGFPTIGFYNDADTGIYRGNLVNYLRFSTGGNEAMTINPNQNIGIGINPTEKLHVDGNILATGTITPDYVFEYYFMGKSNLKPSYEMSSLIEIEEFVKLNNHLPGVPSAFEIEEQGGILVNRATEINLEKIEELFLHTIEQEEKIRTLSSEKEELATKLEALQNEVDEIKQMLIIKKGE